MSSKVLKRMATLAALCLVIMLTLMAGCSSSNKGSAAPGGDASSSGSGYDIVVTDGRLIVYNVTMSVTVENVGETMSQLRSRLREIGGWEQSSQQRDDGYVYCVLRVPTTELSGFLQQIESSGSVNESVITSKDITEKYSEVQKEKEILLSYQTALQQQLEQATTFGEQREIMYELSRVSEQIKSYDKQLTQYEQLADYSTVTLSVYGAETYEEPSYWDRLGAVFFGSTSSLGTLVGVVLQIIAALLPYALLIAAIFGIVVLIIFISCKIRKKKFDLFEKSRRNRELKRLEKQRQDQLKQQRLEVLKQKIESSANGQPKDN